MDIPHSDPPIAHCAAFGLLLYLPNVLEELVCVDTFATFEACATFEHVVESVVMAILPIQPEVTDHCASASMTADIFPYCLACKCSFGKCGASPLPTGNAPLPLPPLKKPKESSAVSCQSIPLV